MDGLSTARRGCAGNDCPINFEWHALKRVANPERPRLLRRPYRYLWDDAACGGPRAPASRGDGRIDEPYAKLAERVSSFARVRFHPQIFRRAIQEAVSSEEGHHELGLRGEMLCEQAT